MRCIRPAIVAPTFNNARTLGALLEALADFALPVIVVDDGCTDETGAILDAWQRGGPGRIVCRHATNQGKAAALRTAFARASSLGLSHVLTIDTDGQHDPADIPQLLKLADKHPDALIVGARERDISGCPMASIVGRCVSNAMIALECGLRVSDSQSGLRVYPLSVVQAMPGFAGRYAFETEIIVRSGWAHVPVIETPIRCVYDVIGGRVTHFKKGRDTLASSWMHLRLLTRSLVPWPVRTLGQAEDETQTGTIFDRSLRWFSPMRAWRSVRYNQPERQRFVAALSLGVLIANLPLYGTQTLLSLLLAKRFQLHPLAVVAGSHLSTPPIGPLLIAMAIGIGHFVLHGEALTWDDLDPRAIGYLDLLRRVATEWIIGSVVCGLSLAAITFALLHALLRWLPEADDAAGPQSTA